MEGQPDRYCPREQSHDMYSYVIYSKFDRQENYKILEKKPKFVLPLPKRFFYLSVN